MTKRIVLYLAIAAVALYIFGRCEGSAGTENASIIAQARQALASGKAYRERQAKLQRIAETHAAAARDAQRVAQIRRGLIAKLDSALDKASTARDSLPIVLQQRDSLQVQAETWREAANQFELALAAAKARGDSAEARVALLERNLTSTLTVAECRILNVGFLPRCPSRTASLVLGVGIGAVGVVVMR